MSKIIKLAAAALVALVALTGCSSQNLDMTTVKAVIDVRTPAEYAAGHLQGAINIDVEGASFNTEIETLDKTANYVVYCHSGRRAGLAVDYMTKDGFTGTVTNAGGIDDASAATKLAIITN
ncbi:MAG: hypothetical protein RLZZ164_345 [Actinomycetota bacterium]|jgi:rhodanese-related sulfurtransferase